MTANDLEHLPGYQKFRQLLEQLFQFDLGDLDFGIYRMLNRRKDVIDRYLAQELPRCLAQGLKIIEAHTRQELEGQIQKTKDRLRQIAPRTLDEAGNLAPQADQIAELTGGEAADLIQQLKTQLQELDRHRLAEDQVNDVLLLVKDFFERYYQDGDFIPAPRFAIGESYTLESYRDQSNTPHPEDFPGAPYRGEEVYFHWPTRGMHYVKSDTCLKQYQFKVNCPGAPARTFYVRFTLNSVEHVADNNKAKRLFFPNPDGVRLEGDTLYIPFDYRTKQEGDPANQEAIFQAVLNPLLERIPDPELRRILTHEPKDDPRERNCILWRRLKHYASLGQKDFFINPQLAAFLTAELDYFIKSQALRFGELKSQEALSYRLATLRAFRTIAMDLIRFLNQLETVQARLFEKKRLVYTADYIIPVAFLPRELWPAVLSSARQLDYWRQEMGLEGEINETTLATHPTLPVYTGHYDESFKRRLLIALSRHWEDLGAITDGILVHAENYGALRTLEARYRGRVRVIYIDPPYNSKTTEILYKNGYKHSTWLTMMEERLQLSKHFEHPKGVHIIAVDENEQERLGLLLQALFPEHHRTCIAIVHNKKGIQGDYFSYNHDYAYFCISPRLDELQGKPVPEEEWEYDNLRKWGKESERHTARNCFYPIFVKNGEIVGFGEVCPDDFHPSSSNLVQEDGIIAVYPVDSKGVERKWRYARDSIESIRHLLRVHTTRQGEVQIQKAKTFRQPKTVWDDPTYIAGDYGTRLLTEMGIVTEEELYPKSLYTVKDSIFITGTGNEDIIMDYFAGSGTTAHAVIDLNRDDGGKRKFVLVEMGEHFDSVLLRRIQKAIYAPEWNSSRPRQEPVVESTAAEVPAWMQRSPRLILVLRLESYEDALFNLRDEPTERDRAYQELYAQADRPDQFFPKECPYLLEYFAEALLEGNTSALRPVDQNGRPLTEWRDPERICVKRLLPGTSKGCTEQRVDWLQTATWWLGLHPLRYEEVEHEGRTYRILKALQGERKVALVVRNAEGLDPETDRRVLERHLGGYSVIVNAPPVSAFEALEDVLAATMLEGPR